MKVEVNVLMYININVDSNVKMKVETNVESKGLPKKRRPVSRTMKISMSKWCIYLSNNLI